jgi:hypothetical protein
MIKSIDVDPYATRKVLRELILLRKLSNLENSIFFTQIYDIILPDGVINKNS